MSITASILRMRRHLVANRLGDLSPRRRRRAALLVLTGLATLLAVGHLAAPALMAPPIDLATPRGLSPGDLPAGAAALEAAFWLSALIAAVLNFRILELLFRRDDIRTLQTLPIPQNALFIDRLGSAVTESVVSALVASLFFVPLIWHDGGAAFVAAAAMLVGSLLFGVFISLAVLLTAARQLLPQDRPDTGQGVLAGAYGGTGQVLLYAPALALGAIVVVALLWKLLLGEPLRLGYLSEPFAMGIVIIAATTVGSWWTARKVFYADYYAIAPRFREADAAEYAAVIDYQTSSYDRPTRWEWGLSTGPARICRALLLDDDRRSAGGRIGYAVTIVLAIIALTMLDLDGIPLWAIALVPAVLTGVVVNPWHRLSQRAELLHRPLALPTTAADRHRAAGRLALREALIAAVPYAAGTALIVGYFRGLDGTGYLAAAAAIAAVIGLSGIVALAQRLGLTPPLLRWLPTVTVAAIAVAATFSLSITAVACLLIPIAPFLLNLGDPR